MSGRQPDGLRDVTERDRLVEAVVDDAEHRGEQRFDIRRRRSSRPKAAQAHQQEREVGPGGVGISVAPLAQLGLEVGEVGQPGDAVGRGDAQALRAAARAADERRQQRMRTPGDQGGRGDGVDGVGGEEHRPGPSGRPGIRRVRDDRTGRDDDRVPRDQPTVPAVHAQECSPRSTYRSTRKSWACAPGTTGGAPSCGQRCKLIAGRPASRGYPTSGTPCAVRCAPSPTVDRVIAPELRLLSARRLLRQAMAWTEFRTTVIEEGP